MNQMKVKSVDSLIERRQQNGETYYYCKFKNCSFGCVSQNVVKNHIKQHSFDVKIEIKEEVIDSVDCEENIVISDVRSIDCDMTNDRSKPSIQEYEEHFQHFQHLNSNESEEIVDKPEGNCGQLKLITEYLEENFINIKNKRKLDNITMDSNDDYNQKMDSYLNISLNSCSANKRSLDSNDKPIKVCKISADYFKLLNKNKEKRTHQKPNEETHNDISLELNSGYISSESMVNNDSDSVDKNRKKKSLINISEVQLIDNKKWHFCLWFGCDFGTIDLKILKKHVRHHNLNDFDKYLCKWIDCNKSFKYKSKLVKHRFDHFEESIVEGLVTYKCLLKDCGFKTSAKYKIISHILDHMNENKKPFCCKIRNCGQKFIEKKYLFNHYSDCHSAYGKKMLLRCGLKNCNFVTYDKQLLKDHKWVNHLIKVRQQRQRQQFFCDFHECSQIFSKQLDLEIHSLKHKLKKFNSFKCTENGCNYKTNNKSLFQNHIQTHN